MEVLSKYSIVADQVPGTVTIIKRPDEYTPLYEITFPKIAASTDVILNSIKEKLIENVKIKISEILDPKALEDIKKRFMDSAGVYVSQELPRITQEEKNILSGYLVHEMLGLGKLEVLLNDDGLEEVVVNNSAEPL